jgi:hypothetical protein
MLITTEALVFCDAKSKIDLLKINLREIAGWSFAPDRVNLKMGGLMEKDQSNIKGFTTRVSAPKRCGGINVRYRVRKFATSLAHTLKCWERL